MVCAYDRTEQITMTETPLKTNAQTSATVGAEPVLANHSTHDIINQENQTKFDDSHHQVLAERLFADYSRKRTTTHECPRIKPEDD